MTFGEQLRKARQGLKMKQDALAWHLGVSRSSVQNYENNRDLPNLTTLIKLTCKLQTRFELGEKGQTIVVSVKGK